MREIIAVVSIFLFFSCGSKRLSSRACTLCIGLLAGIASGCGLPRDFYSSHSPDGKNRITVRQHYLLPDYVVWFTVSQGWSSRTIYTVPSDSSPRYAEALWQTNSRVAVLYCDSLAGNEVIGYDFDQAERINFTASEQFKAFVRGQYGKALEDLQDRQRDVVDWYCERKSRAR
jgi:hypothetical protein